MDLRSVRVTNYKTVADSGLVTIEPGVTCLVGKNESGKTSLLEALYRLRPVPSGHPQSFDGLRDYPRRLYGRDKSKIASLPAITATFELTASEVQEIETRFGSGALESPMVTATKAYESDNRTWTVTSNAQAMIEHVKTDSRLAGVDVAEASSIPQIISAIDEVSEPPSPLQQIRGELADEGPFQRLNNHLRDRMPRFIYFSHYDLLPGVVSVRRLQNTDPDELEAGERTALSLLRLAGVESEEFTEDNYESRKAALEAAANTLTDEVFEFWTQNGDLQVDLDIEFRKNDATPNQPEPFLQIRIRNNRHRVTLNFAERSAGFVWFFSFLAFFSEFRGGIEQLVLLLDEPGLNLHGTAQADLLRYIDERLADEHQVIYTTHSPFMIQADRLERARLVEDVDRIGTVVTDDAVGTSDETQFPIHAAIGIKATQTLFIGPSTLVVEGNADLVYLRTMSRHLKALKRTSLDQGWTVLPVGGLDKMPTFIALLAPQVFVAALHDVAKKPPQKLTNLVERNIIEEDRLVPLTQFTNSKEADIEDMFPVDFYLELLKESGVADIDGDDLKGNGRIVPRAEVAAGGTFSHYAPARHMATHADEILTRLDDATCDRFEALFEHLNEMLATSG